MVEDVQCTSAEALLFALRFMYTSDKECPFERDWGVLMQLLKLCESCQLPAPLSSLTLGALFNHIQIREVAMALLDTVMDATETKVPMTGEQRLFLARCFVSREGVWDIAEEGIRGKILERALLELEPALVAKVVESACKQAVSSVARGCGGQALSAAPLGTGWLQPQSEDPRDPLCDIRSEAPTHGTWYQGVAGGG